MKNLLFIENGGEVLRSSTDDGTNRLFVNDIEINSESLTGDGVFTYEVNGYTLTIKKIKKFTGNIILVKTSDFVYELRNQEIDNVLTLDKIYPIGSIYMSVNNVSPTELFGGTWEQIQDTFLLSAGSKYEAGSTGGEAEHTLNTDEIPSHNHDVTGGAHKHDIYYRAKYVITGTAGGLALSTQATETKSNAMETGGSHTHDVSSIGGGQAHNNMPPYLAVYVWKRTA